MIRDTDDQVERDVAAAAHVVDMARRWLAARLTHGYSPDRDLLRHAERGLADAVNDLDRIRGEW